MTSIVLQEYTTEGDLILNNRHLYIDDCGIVQEYDSPITIPPDLSMPKTDCRSFMGKKFYADLYRNRYVYVSRRLEYCDMYILLSTIPTLECTVLWESCWGNCGYIISNEHDEE
jgi:hypothetical protein